MKRFSLVLLGGLLLADFAMAQVSRVDYIGKATHELMVKGLFIAHPTLQLYSTVNIANLATGKKIKVIVIDRIPSSPDRIADLSPDVWKELDLTQGTYIRIFSDTEMEYREAVLNDLLEEIDSKNEDLGRLKNEIAQQAAKAEKDRESQEEVLKKLKDQIESAREDLEKQQIELEQRAAKAEKDRESQEEVLKKLKAQIDSKNEDLKTLEREKELKEQNLKRLKVEFEQRAEKAEKDRKFWEEEIKTIRENIKSEEEGLARLKEESELERQKLQELKEEYAQQSATAEEDRKPQDAELNELQKNIKAAREDLARLKEESELEEQRLEELKKQKELLEKEIANILQPAPPVSPPEPPPLRLLPVQPEPPVYQPPEPLPTQPEPPVYQPPEPLRLLPVQPEPPPEPVKILGSADPASGKLYKLQIGSFSSLDAANRIAHLAKSVGFNVILEQSGAMFRVLAIDVPAAMINHAVQRLGQIGIKQIWIKE